MLRIVNVVVVASLIEHLSSEFNLLVYSFISRVVSMHGLYRVNMHCLQHQRQYKKKARKRHEELQVL